MKDTDATGVCYFTTLFTYAQEAFEEFVWQSGKALGEELYKEKCALPIRSSSGEFLAPLRWGDEIRIEWEPLLIKNSSFSYESTICQEEVTKAKVTICHIAVSIETGEKISLPWFLRELIDPSYERGLMEKKVIV